MSGQRRRPPSALAQSASPPIETGSDRNDRQPLVALERCLDLKLALDRQQRNRCRRPAAHPGFRRLSAWSRRCICSRVRASGLANRFHEGKVGVAPDRSRRGAGRVREGSRRSGPGAPARSPTTMRAGKAGPREVLSQPVEAPCRRHRAPRPPPPQRPVAASCHPVLRNMSSTRRPPTSPRSFTGRAAAASCTHHAPSAKPGRAET